MTGNRNVNVNVAIFLVITGCRSAGAPRVLGAFTRGARLGGAS
ncbi:hypothetical protein ABLG96_08385 [Nakamurella sp. A5-74]|uniref:Lipoprotein n=1 Tax=Nakamurella sp. A5-74 TaxID=3158264 RepID=A0AAU8DV18_9ACTN